ncbi:MAG: Fic family protein [Collinsella sp.]|nr:Fic family protein [Collinsella sp.]
MLAPITPGRQGNVRHNLSGALAYDSFRPANMDSFFPLDLSVDSMRLISDCRAILGEVEGMSRFVPNIDMYLSMYVRKEALLSSQIEGTQCTFDDVLDPSNESNASRDLTDVVNYTRAVQQATELMEELPLCMRLLKSVHATLLGNGRGSDKTPGQFRTTQNWVGPNGCTLNEAPYVPPNTEDMKEALGDLELFINERDDIDPVIKAALVHYQFETTHPFLDGNGRLGRLLILLSLIHDGALTKPVIYPSYELKRRRSEYYDWLMRVRQTGDFEGWVSFFSTCLLASAREARDSMRKLVDLHSETERLILEKAGRATTNALMLLDLLEGNPIVDIAFVSERMPISRSSANNLISQFTDWGILVQRDTSRKRYRTFSYEPYLAILRTGDEPL